MKEKVLEIIARKVEEMKSEINALEEESSSSEVAALKEENGALKVSLQEKDAVVSDLQAKLAEADKLAKAIDAAIPDQA